MVQQKRRKSDNRAADDFCRRFGAVAVQKRFVSAEQLKAALLEQIDDDVEGREHRLLGSILFDRGWITEQQIEQVLLEIRKDL